MGNFVIFILLSAAISSKINAQFLLNGYGSHTNVNFKLDAEKKVYSYNFLSPDGTSKNEEGYFETDPATGEESLVVRGSYQYIRNDGFYYTVLYTADKNGYHPTVLIPSRGGGTSFAPAPGAAAGAAPVSGGGKGIDPAVLCSLIGGGCK